MGADVRHQLVGSSNGAWIFLGSFRWLLRGANSASPPQSSGRACMPCIEGYKF